ncbi:MAG: DegT/DnrJ/EryC1/StrS family aminotransferase [Spirochaetaceae bacterium]
MDSVLTYLVDTNVDYIGELSRSFKKITDHEYIHFYRGVEHALIEILNTFSDNSKGEIILSALSPYYFYETIINCGFVPVVVDVAPESGLPEIKTITDNITENTILIISTFSNCIKPDIDGLSEIDVPTLEVLLPGIGRDSENETITGNSPYTIISFEDENILSSMGGALISHNKKELSGILDNRLKKRPDICLSGLNASFLNSQISDLNIFFDKRYPIIEIYKDSTLKSGYYTFDNSESNSYNYFPVVLKKSLKEVQKYCKSQGVETIKGYEGCICNNINNLKCSNAKSLSNRTLLFPLSLNMKKDSIKLISKILSTLP